MNLRGETFEKVDRKTTFWMAKNGLSYLRISIGSVFFWFGILKFFSGLSPAEGIAVETIRVFSINLLSETVILYGLGLWEVLIGIGLLFKLFMRETLLLLFTWIDPCFMAYFKKITQLQTTDLVFKGMIPLWSSLLTFHIPASST